MSGKFFLTRLEQGQGWIFFERRAQVGHIDQGWIDERQAFLAAVIVHRPILLPPNSFEPLALPCNQVRPTRRREDVFGPGYNQPPGQFPQYDAVGKVRVDPNDGSTVVAGTKKGAFISYNGGVDWTGPCTINGAGDQRQDVTGLELSDMGGGATRIIAAVGVRGSRNLRAGS